MFFQKFSFYKHYFQFEHLEGNGERLVKIHLQDATTSTKHVGFRIDKSCQTVLLVNGGSSTP